MERTGQIPVELHPLEAHADRTRGERLGGVSWFWAVNHCPAQSPSSSMAALIPTLGGLSQQEYCREFETSLCYLARSYFKKKRFVKKN